jgi:hypothetical protein
MQLALLAGFHKTAALWEYGSAVTPDGPSNRPETVRTWFCCCFVNATSVSSQHVLVFLTLYSLSIELGLPASIPQDRLCLEDLRDAALPPDFENSMRMTFQSMKLYGMIDSATTEVKTTNLGLLGMLESDLHVVADLANLGEAHPLTLTTFSLLVAKLNLFAFVLPDAFGLATREAMQLQLSAFECATNLIQIFTTRPFLPHDLVAHLSTVSMPMQAYYPRSYWHAFVYACLILLKLSHMKSLPEFAASPIDDTIGQAVDLLFKCSSSEVDILHRMAVLIRFLNQEGVSEVVKPQKEVHSRMGASLLYEMIKSAIACQKQREKELQKATMKVKPAIAVTMTQSNHSSPLGSISPGTVNQFLMVECFPDAGSEFMDYDMNDWDVPVFDQVYCW